MRVRESALRDVARLAVWYPGRLAVGFLPARASFFAFERLGDLHRLLAPAASREAGARIAGWLPASTEAARAGRDYVRNHYADRLHILLYPRVTRRAGPPSWLAIEGREHLTQALAAGRGAVVVHPHYAVPQLLPLALGLSGVRCLQLGLPSDQGLSRIGRSVAFRARVELERMLPARILPGDTFLRPAFQWLEDGGVVLVTGDGTGGGRDLGRFAPVPFCGRSVTFPVGPARLALKTSAPLLPAIVERAACGRYVARLHAPFSSDALDPDAGARELTALFAAWFEARLRAAPGCWHFWDEIDRRVAAA